MKNPFWGVDEKYFGGIKDFFLEKNKSRFKKFHISTLMQLKE
jgi:hypothetical protein